MTTPSASEEVDLALIFLIMTVERMRPQELDTPASSRKGILPGTGKTDRNIFLDKKPIHMFHFLTGFTQKFFIQITIYDKNFSMLSSMIFLIGLSVTFQDLNLIVGPLISCFYLFIVGLFVSFACPISQLSCD